MKLSKPKPQARRRTIFIAVNGILTFPGDAKNWTGKCVTWIQTKCADVKAEKVEYWCGPIDRVFGQTGRAAKLFKTISFYAGWDIVLIGHSNGCDVIVDMLRDYPTCPKIKYIHLVSGACEANFNRNGLNDALIENRVENVAVYVSGRDWALRIAHIWLAQLLGYGVLGLHGPRAISESISERVKIVKYGPADRWPVYGHSSCWLPENFDDTMTLFACVNV